MILLNVACLYELSYGNRAIILTCITPGIAFFCILPEITSLIGSDFFDKKDNVKSSMEQRDLWTKFSTTS